MWKDHVLMDRGNVNDAAWFFGGDKLTHKRLREEKRTLQIHTEYRVIICLGDVGEVGGLFDSRVVDKDVARIRIRSRHFR